MYVCQVYSDPSGGRKKASDSLEVELWAVINHPTLLLGFELGLEEQGVLFFF